MTKKFHIKFDPPPPTTTALNIPPALITSDLLMFQDEDKSVLTAWSQQHLLSPPKIPSSPIDIRRRRRRMVGSSTTNTTTTTTNTNLTPTRTKMMTPNRKSSASSIIPSTPSSILRMVSIHHRGSSSNGGGSSRRLERHQSASSLSPTSVIIPSVDRSYDTSQTCYEVFEEQNQSPWAPKKKKKKKKKKKRATPTKTVKYTSTKMIRSVSISSGGSSSNDITANDLDDSFVTTASSTIIPTTSFSTPEKKKRHQHQHNMRSKTSSSSSLRLRLPRNDMIYEEMQQQLDETVTDGSDDDGGAAWGLGLGSLDVDTKRRRRRRRTTTGRAVTFWDGGGHISDSGGATNKQEDREQRCPLLGGRNAQSLTINSTANQELVVSSHLDDVNFIPICPHDGATTNNDQTTTNNAIIRSRSALPTSQTSDASLFPYNFGDVWRSPSPILQSHQIQQSPPPLLVPNSNTNTQPIDNNNDNIETNTSHSEFMKIVASIVLQTFFRRHLAYCLAWKRYSAALTIQRFLIHTRRSILVSPNIATVPPPPPANPSTPISTPNTPTTKFFRKLCTLAAIQIQAAFRGFWVRDCANVDNYCASLIQRNVRSFLLRSHSKCRSSPPLPSPTLLAHTHNQNPSTSYLYLYHITLLQSIARRYITVSKLDRARRNCATIMIQAEWRRYDATLGFMHILADVLIVQSVCRRFLVWKRKRVAVEEDFDLRGRGIDVDLGVDVDSVRIVSQAAAVRDSVGGMAMTASSYRYRMTTPAATTTTNHRRLDNDDRHYDSGSLTTNNLSASFLQMDSAHDLISKWKGRNSSTNHHPRRRRLSPRPQERKTIHSVGNYVNTTEVSE